MSPVHNQCDVNAPCYFKGGKSIHASPHLEGRLSKSAMITAVEGQINNEGGGGNEGLIRSEACVPRMNLISGQELSQANWQCQAALTSKEQRLLHRIA